MTAIIGITGRKRAGKDTFASFLTKHYGYVRIGLADAVRDALYALNPFLGGSMRVAELVDVVGWEKAKGNPEVRRLLQNFGTESIRAIDPDLWIRALARKAEQHELVVVTDVRFPNELAWVESQGGTTVRVINPRTETLDPHASETALEGYDVDCVVYNTGSLADLEQEALEVGWTHIFNNGLAERE